MHKYNEKFIKMITETLRMVGVKSGQQLLDFGCGSGDYAIPAAKIIGENGVVYAVDKDKYSLKLLRQKALSFGINNIQIVKTSGEIHLPVPDISMDAILLYDVLHSYYFTPTQRYKFLKEVRRIAKKESVISVYPKHMDSNVIADEMVSIGIHFHEKFYVDILHYHAYERDHLFNFRID